MDQALKQRLVGAVVVIAALVVAIPAFLGGDQVAEQEPIAIPNPPHPETETRLLPLTDADAPVVDPSPSVQTGAEIVLDAPAQDSDAQARNTKVVEPPDLPGDAAVLSDQSLRRKAVQNGKKVEPAPEPLAPPARSNRASSARGLGFAVQLGGFSKQENALSLQSMLRNAGFAAYVESIQRQGRTLYRVRVGPRLQRGDAQALLENIRKTIGIEGMVVPAS